MPTWSSKCEPPHDKTNKMNVRPAKTRISLGIRPVWSESSLSAWRKLGSLTIHWAHSEDSDQTGLSLRWVHTHFVGFLMSWLGQIRKSYCYSSTNVTYNIETLYNHHIHGPILVMNISVPLNSLVCLCFTLVSNYLTHIRRNSISNKSVRSFIQIYWHHKTFTEHQKIQLSVNSQTKSTIIFHMMLISSACSVKTPAGFIITDAFNLLLCHCPYLC